VGRRESLAKDDAQQSASTQAGWDTLQFFDIPFMWRRPLKSWLLYFGEFSGCCSPNSPPGTMKGLFQGNFSTWLDLSIWRENLSYAAPDSARALTWE